MVDEILEFGVPGSSHRRRSQYVEGMYRLHLQRSTVPTGHSFTDIPDGMFLHILSHT